MFLDAVAETNLIVVTAKAKEAFIIDEVGHKHFVQTPVTATVLDKDDAVELLS
jgi:hypothetical protein